MPLVGRSVPRKDAWEKVTGKVRYLDDYAYPGMLHVATVRSPVAYGVLKSVDCSKAKTLPGVKAVVTACDIPGRNSVPLVYDDQPFLAEGYVRFFGEPIALVAAETLQQARAAADSVTCNIEKLSPILSIREAIAEGASKIYKSDNIFTRYVIRKGDADAAMSRCAKVFEREYETPYQEHAYLETQGMIAVPGMEESMTVYGSMQCPFYVHDAVAQILGKTRNKVRIMQTTTGGGFGGKEDFPSVVAGHAALLAQKLNRPVKLVYTRDEDIISSSKRHPGLIRMKIGIDESGKIKAAVIDYYLDGGAYATLTPIVLWRGAVHALGPYSCPDVLIQAYGVATNKVPCGAYRGFGSPQVIFAGESMIDEIACETGLNPLEMRMRNILTVGSATATDQKIDHSCGLSETVSKAVEHSGWNSKWQHPGGKTGRLRRGIGISTIYYGVGLGAGGKHLDRAGSSMTIMKDGSVLCSVGNVEMGQGARTVLAQIAADALGAPYEAVNVVETDTSAVPDSGPTVASRTTLMSGNALIDAALQLKPRLIEAAAELLGTDIPNVGLIDGYAFDNTAKDDKKIPFTELAAKMYAMRLMPSAFGWFVAPNTSYDSATGQGDAYFVYSYATNIAEVEVDVETGEYRVERITAAHDMGKAVNPQQVEGQIEGGTLQGFGYCTMEEIRHDVEGRMLNTGFATYILPTTQDAPTIEPIIVEHGYDKGPFGAKGFGEVPLMGIAPAISNAVFNATGKRIRILPILPEKLYEE